MSFFEKDLTEATMLEEVFCDVCRIEGKKVVALYDAKVKAYSGRWGYLCQNHFDQFSCKLGTGLGQKLVYKLADTRHR